MRDDYVTEAANTEWTNGVHGHYCYSYKWGRIERYYYIKYMGDSNMPKILEPEDDAATVHLGQKWHVARTNEYREMRENCVYTSMEYPERSGKLYHFYFKAKNAEDKGKKLAAEEARAKGYTIDDPHIMFTCESMLFDFPEIEGKFRRFELSFWTSEVLRVYMPIFNGYNTSVDPDDNDEIYFDMRYLRFYASPHPLRATYKE